MGRHVAVTGLQDGVGIQVGGQLERMAVLLLFSLGGMAEVVLSMLPQSSFFLSLTVSLFLSLITHVLVQTVCLPGISRLLSAAVEKHIKHILGRRNDWILSSVIRKLFILH